MGCGFAALKFFVVNNAFGCSFAVTVNLAQFYGMSPASGVGTQE
jgi:hypothetical protein